VEEDEDEDEIDMVAHHQGGGQHQVGEDEDEDEEDDTEADGMDGTEEEGSGNGMHLEIGHMAGMIHHHNHHAAQHLPPSHHHLIQHAGMSGHSSHLAGVSESGTSEGQSLSMGHGISGISGGNSGFSVPHQNYSNPGGLSGQHLPYEEEESVEAPDDYSGSDL